MGVHGLWQLLQSTSKTVSLESLEGKVLAVDVSIWLHQAIKGMRGRDGQPLPNAHLQVLFNRICKLLYYRIKPVFVFDGGVPVLKKQTLASRRERKDFAEQESEKTSKKLLENLMRSRAVKEVLSGEADTETKPVKLKNRAKDLFELPPVPDEFNILKEELEKDKSWEERKQTQKMIQEELAVSEDIDTTSEDFQALPPELRHEIITELKERTKRTTWTNIDELPEESDDFSKYQMKKLLKKGKLTHQLDDLKKEMNTRSTRFITPGFSDDYYSDNIQTQKLVSSDTAHYVLIKGIGQKKQKELAKAHLEERIGRQLSSEENSELIDEGKEDERFKDNISESGVDLKMNEKVKDTGNDARKVKVNSSKNEFVHNKSENISSDVVVDIEDDTEQIVRKTKTNDVIDLSDDSSTKSDGIIKIPDEEDDPKPSTSKSGLGASSEFVAHHLESDDDDDETNDGISQQEILAMIKNENKKQSNPALATTTFTISDDEDSDNSDTDVRDETKAKSPQNKTAMAAQAETDVQILRNRKAILRDLDDMKTKITERKRRLSLEQEVSLDIKKRKALEENEMAEERPETIKGDNPVVIDDDSEDEGFIEVSVNPTEAHEDELFPEDIFTATDTRDSNSQPDSEKTMIEKMSDDTALGEITPSDHTSPVKKTKLDDGTEIRARKESFSADKEEHAADHLHLAKDFEGLNEFDIQEWQNDLKEETKTLQEEMRKQDRIATSITDDMFVEAQALLKIFGLPFVVSPMEAEAQCAQLDQLDLTQGTITDDSDVWLFGGKRVYKNFYQKDKHVEFYSNASIQSQLGLDRQLLINIALLCGSDYTGGIQGVGPIKAMEIMTEFPGQGISGLQHFRDWWEQCQTQPKFPHEPKIRSQLRKLDVTPGFPNPAVVDAYLKPAIDESDERFSWSKPDLYQLREFAGEKLGWSKSKIDETLLPVMKRLNEHESKINRYFQPENFVKPAKVKSKRLKSALDKFVGTSDTKNDTREHGSKVKETGDPKVKKTSGSKVKGQGDTVSEEAPVIQSEEYKKMAKLACEVEEFKVKNQMDNSNFAKLQRVRERLGIKMPKVKMPKGKGRGRGRVRGNTASSNTESSSSGQRTAGTKIKNEIDLSESSGSSGDELIANLDLDAMMENAGEVPQGSQVSKETVESEDSREPGGFIIAEDDGSDNDGKCNKKTSRNYGKGKGKGKSSNKKGQSSSRGHSLTSSLRNKSTRASKSKAESRLSRLQLSESDSEND